MKINWKLTNGLKDLITDDDSIVLSMLSSLIIPVLTAVLLFHLTSGASIIFGLLIWLAEIIGGYIVSEETSIPTEKVFFFIWIPFILLAPITIPVDIFTSVSKGIWKWFSKRKSENKIRAAWTHLIEKGLDPKKIGFDKLDKNSKSLSEIARELFEEVILDHLGRSLFPSSEEISIIRYEKHGGKICVIGSLSILENKSRTDGSPDTTVLGRVIGITFSVSKNTGICSVIHYISEPLWKAHEDENVEDMWFNLLNSSGISSESAKDPLERRKMRHFVDEESGVIIEDPVGSQTDCMAELE